MKWLDDHCTAWARTVSGSVGGSGSDTSHWMPFDPFLFYPHVSDLWIDKLYRAKKIFDEKRIPLQTIADTFFGPQIVRVELLMFALLDLKASGYFRTEKGKELIDFFGKLITIKCVDDPFGMTSTKTHTPTEVRELRNTIPWERAKGNDGRLIGNCINACTQLSYAYFTDYCYMQWYDNFGPYNFLKGNEPRQLLIRSYRNFRPTTVWPDAKTFPHSEIILFTEYANTDITLDQWGHQWSTVPLAQNLVQCAVRVDGTYVNDREVLHAMITTIGDAAARVYTAFRNFDFETKKEKLLELRFYGFKQFFDLAGMDWQMGAHKRERIKGKQLLKAEYPDFPSPEAADTWWKSFIDPRTLGTYPASWQRP